VQLARTDLLALLTKLLDRYAVSAASLTLEITESVLMEHTGQMRDTLERIQALDVGLCMDDFGTGYSSLTNLRRFPIGGLKIDQTFIAAMLTREDDRKIVHTIIDLAHNLGIHCVAEGVENEQQLAELKRLGCDYAQGFLFSKAVDAERALAMIQGLSPRRSLGS
jgi:EAL domain-containing protein (putative c-di-GMP-specific phosphodiesterase class I)